MAAEFCPEGEKVSKSIGQAKSVFSQVTGLGGKARELFAVSSEYVESAY